ncbi:hypothetical protein ACGFYV_31245 [Streptomyces sp. NPDC048297]|uniref:hypothetical protein n=1 Tax=Streptomyces sp. NPDC048297 TaxID=3365531 RepID=UPI0037130D9F
MKLHRIPVIIAAALAAVGAAGTCITDQLVVHTARQHITHAVHQRLHPSGAVTVQLTDALAGLNTLTGTFGTVRITADGVHRGTLDLENITATLHDVTTHGSTTGGTATATIPYTALMGHLGTQAAHASIATDGDEVTLTQSAGTLGLPVTVAARITTTAHSITLIPTTVSVLGRALPVSAVAHTLGANSLAVGLTPRTVYLKALPARAQLSSARPGPSGLALKLIIPATHTLAAT